MPPRMSARPQWSVRFEVDYLVRASTHDGANAAKDRKAAEVQRALRRLPGMGRIVVDAGPAESLHPGHTVLDRVQALAAAGGPA